MVIFNLVPRGVMQHADVLHNGYWHARSPEFLNQGTMRIIEWLRMPGDLILIGLVVVPAVAAEMITYLRMKPRAPLE